MTRNRILILIAVFFLSSFAIGLILGPTKCRDGFSSGSIGKRGACSHHGGVDGMNGMIRFIGSIAFTFFVFVQMHKRNSKTEKMVQLNAVDSALAVSQLSTNLSLPIVLKDRDISGPNEVVCPKCGSNMVRRLTKKGKYKGIEFMGCKRYPGCRGIKSI